MTILLALTVAALYAFGVFLMLQRRLSRIVIGLAIIGHGANLLLLAAGGPAGEVPIVGADPSAVADPLPQALALTAIVITFGVSGLLLALSYRSWVQRRDDEVEDDVEDRRIAQMRRALDAAGEAREAAEDEAEMAVGAAEPDQEPR